MDKLKEFFVKYRKPIIIIVVIIVLYLIWNKYGYKLKRLFNPAQGNNSPIPLSDVRKNQIEEHMGKISQDITGWSWVGNQHDYALYHTLLGWYDDEIAYGADYYKNFLGQGNSLYSDLDGEYFYWGDVNNQVLNKLKELGKDN